MRCPFAPIIAAPGPEREDRLVTEELHFPASNAARATPSKSGSGVRSGAAGPSGVCSLEQKPSGNRETQRRGRGGVGVAHPGNCSPRFPQRLSQTQDLKSLGL